MFNQKEYAKLWKERQELLQNLNFYHFDFLTGLTDRSIDLEYGTHLFNKDELDVPSVQIPEMPARFTLSALGAWLTKEPIYPKDYYNADNWYEQVVAMDRARLFLAKEMIQKQKLATYRGVLRTRRILDNIETDYAYNPYADAGIGDVNPALKQEIIDYGRNNPAEIGFDYSQSAIYDDDEAEDENEEDFEDEFKIIAKPFAGSAADANLLRCEYIADMIGNNPGSDLTGEWHLGMFFPRVCDTNYYVDSANGIIKSGNTDTRLSLTPLFYQIGHPDSYRIYYQPQEILDMYSKGDLSGINAPEWLKKEIISTYIAVSAVLRYPMEDLMRKSLIIPTDDVKVINTDQYLIPASTIKDELMGTTVVKMEKTEPVQKPAPEPEAIMRQPLTQEEIEFDGWLASTREVNGDAKFYIKKPKPVIYGDYYANDHVYQIPLRADDPLCDFGSLKVEGANDPEFMQSNKRQQLWNNRAKETEEIADKLDEIDAKLKAMGEDIDYSAMGENLEERLVGMAKTNPDLKWFDHYAQGTNPSLDPRIEMQSPLEACMSEMTRSDMVEFSSLAYIRYHALKGLPKEMYHKQFQFLADLKGDEKQAKKLAALATDGVSFFRLIEGSPYGYINHVCPKAFLGVDWINSYFCENPYEDQVPGRNWDVKAPKRPSLPDRAVELEATEPHYSSLDSIAVFGSCFIASPFAKVSHSFEHRPVKM